jgi:DnaK suppressor protein
VDVTYARKLLKGRLTDISHSSAVLVAENAERSPGARSHLRQDPNDQGSDISDADREGAVLDAQQADRVLIEAALNRVEEGTFGRCIDCGKVIPDERLEARPEVARCVQDQQRFESRRR